MGAILPLALTACSGSTVGDTAVIDRPPPSLAVPCDGPAVLPARSLTQAEAETLWGRDRAALRRCGGQVRGLADWLAERARR